MSEAIHANWPSPHLAPLEGALESLLKQLEVTRLQHTVSSQAREISRLTEEIESFAGKMVIGSEQCVSVMRWLWKATWASVGRVEGTSWNSGGNHLRGVFDFTISEVESIREAVATYEEKLGRPLGRERVERALSEARQLRSDLDTNWLWFTKESEEEAKAAIAGGEGVDVEEAFAQMAGVTVEDLRARVEAHRQKYHPSSNGAR